MRSDQGVLGVFSYLDSTVQTVKKLKEEGYSNLRVYRELIYETIQDDTVFLSFKFFK